MLSAALAVPPAPGRPAPRPADEPYLPEVERRFEDWLNGHLDPDASAEPDSRPSLEVLLESFDAGRTGRSRAANAPSPGRARGPAWEKLRVSRSRGGITVVRFRDARLLREDDLRTAAEELTALARAGHHRVLLNFAGVERMSSQIVGAVASARKRCAEADGGALRVCNLNPELAVVFELTRLAGALAIFPDERSALDAPWPEPRGPRPLPVNLIAALKGRVGRDGPDEAGRPGPLSIAEEPSTELELRVGPSLHLVALSGRGRGRTVAVDASPFVLGRDVGCDLRADWPTISRRHAVIERLGGRALVRDLGTTNGTLHNGRALHGESAELADGDTIGVGPLSFAVAFDRPAEPEPRSDPVADDLVASWLRDPEDEADDPDAAPVPEEGEGERPFKVEVVEDVLILSPTSYKLEGDARLDALREALVELLDGHGPRRVVVNLVRVGTLSSRAIGLFLAHALRLERLGGTLRLAQPSAPVMALLEGVRLPMLVEVFPTLDEAVLATWSVRPG
jgi:anti-anti-sigma factor